MWCEWITYSRLLRVDQVMAPPVSEPVNYRSRSRLAYHSATAPQCGRSVNGRTNFSASNTTWIGKKVIVVDRRLNVEYKHGTNCRYRCGVTSLKWDSNARVLLCTDGASQWSVSILSATLAHCMAAIVTKTPCTAAILFDSDWSDSTFLFV